MAADLQSLGYPDNSSKVDKSNSENDSVDIKRTASSGEGHPETVTYSRDLYSITITQSRRLSRWELESKAAAAHSAPIAVLTMSPSTTEGDFPDPVASSVLLQVLPLQAPRKEQTEHVVQGARQH
ncbi:uncharacterized protein LOC123223979 [Mangifera indica]|uniref:uncharacterized protein LOC123223979 n=1 Tax=Mangifera indica TaxID=29780 RepID=UPI001CFC3505|nr:uncharacterized protein LOC123223979 [Mangifera indica]